MANTKMAKLVKKMGHREAMTTYYPTYIECIVNAAIWLEEIWWPIRLIKYKALSQLFYIFIPQQFSLIVTNIILILIVIL